MPCQPPASARHCLVAGSGAFQGVDSRADRFVVGSAAGSYRLGRDAAGGVPADASVDCRGLVAAVLVAVVVAEPAASGWHAFAAVEFAAIGRGLAGGTAGADGQVVAAAVPYSSGEDSLEPGWRRPCAVRSRSDLAGAGCTRAATIGSPVGALLVHRTRIRPGPSPSEAGPRVHPGTSSDPPEGSAVKHVAVAAAVGAAAVAVAVAESAVEADLTIRSPAEASCRPSLLAVWGTEALMSPAEDNRSCAADSWLAFAVAWAAVLGGGRSPSGHRTDLPEVVVAVGHPTARLPCRPYRTCDPASSTCCRSWPAGTWDTVTVAAAAASGAVPYAERTGHRHCQVDPFPAVPSDRIDSRRPF